MHQFHLTKFHLSIDMKLIAVATWNAAITFNNNNFYYYATSIAVYDIMQQ